MKAGFDGGGAVYNLVDLRNKKILITGSSSGIGRGTAILLSKLGAKIILTARREEALRETLEMLEGDGHSFYLLDVRQTDTIDECVKKLLWTMALWMVWYFVQELVEVGHCSNLSH